MSIESIKSIIQQELPELSILQKESIYEKIKAALEPRRTKFNASSYFNSKIKENDKSSMLLAITAATIMRMNNQVVDYARQEILPEIEFVNNEDCLKLFVKASRAIVSNEQTLSTISMPLVEQIEDQVVYDPLDDLG